MGFLATGDYEMTEKRLAMFSPALLALYQPLLGFAQQTQQPTGPQWDWPGPWHMMGGGWGFWWMFPLFMLFMMAVCFGVFFLGHRLGDRHHHSGPWHMMDRLSGPGRSWGDPTSSALQILNERFARGEIEKPEYEEKKAVILSSGQH
jgi:putative membrane protein